MVQRKTKAVWEFGDFQTPEELALEVASSLLKFGVRPTSIVEPTCGKGNLLISALKVFSQVEKAVGIDINSKYLQILQSSIVKEDIVTPVTVRHSDFFLTDWKCIIDELPEPILIIGNPPWVTSADLGTLQSSNLPEKSNFQGHNGLSALTGKSNFDISEWMLLQNLEWLQAKTGTIAMLCKTAVARKVLLAAWKKNTKITSARILQINAKKHFDASVDACLFIMQLEDSKPTYRCEVYNSISSLKLESEIGYRNNTVIPNIHVYDELSYLLGEDDKYTWRSGVKHDCSRVMELEDRNGIVFNGDDIVLNIEHDYLFPMFKSSDIGNNRVSYTNKLMLVTQKYIGEDTYKIKEVAPKTWYYLQQNSDALSKRGSSIYKNRPEFSIFGVGDYTFSPWKVAISGFYKKLQFAVVGSQKGKPAVFDDTVYFLPCYSKEEADFIVELLTSELAKEFFHSLIFWEDKRPITIETLRKLHIGKLARAHNKEDVYLSFILERGEQTSTEGTKQLRLLEKRQKYKTAKLTKPAG